MSAGLILRLLIRQNIKMTDEDKREQHTLYFYNALLREAVFECLLEEWKNIETDKRTALKKEMDTDSVNSENEENKMRILQEWKKKENDTIAEENPTKTGPVITKIYYQKIAENPFKHAEGYVYQNPEKQNAKGKPKKKREIRREEKRRLTRTREEEKTIKEQFEAIDTLMENYSREVRIQWKKELKREQMTKMSWRERRRQLEKGMKTNKEEKEKVQIKMLINDIRNIDILDMLFPDDIDMEKEEEKEESKETQTNINVKIDEQREEKKKTVTERIRSFFMSLCCIKGQ
ncbi:golgin subfamily A member 6-like protein 26 isoform X2 [Mytilus trossulus]|uniref:golgin subfamily A member 6-like protein 26 isoform X2 n=1 Tax=Mytilus trossulus TaxID=6551 RepID=UPI003007ED7B